MTINEADLIPSVTQHYPAPCTGVGGTCLVPDGGTVRIFDDTANPTVFVEAPVLRQPVDVAPTSGMCVHVNATC